jgi:hypothetical protein
MNDPRLFSKLLVSVYEMKFERDTELTTEDIRNNLFADNAVKGQWCKHPTRTLVNVFALLLDDELLQMIDRCVRIINDGVRDNWDINDLEAHLPKVA